MYKFHHSYKDTNIQTMSSCNYNEYENNDSTITTKYVCECGRSFNKQTQFNYHKKNECGRVFVCDICQTPSTTMSNLRRHQKLRHKPEVDKYPIY